MNETPELTDRQYEIADAVSLFLDTHRVVDYSPSQIARAVKCETHEIYPVLNDLAANHYIVQTGRGGAWARYAYKIYPGPTH